MLLGLATFIRGQKHLHGHAEPREPEILTARSIIGLNVEHSIYLFALLGTVVVWQMLQFHGAVGMALNGLSIAVLAAITWFIVTRCNAVERGRMIALVILTMSTVVFWALFEQAAGSMTLFADRVMDREIFGLTLTAAQYGSLNSLFIFLLAPFFAWLWTALNQRGMEPSTPVKFALGIAQAGLGFGALVWGAANPDAAGLVAGYWMVLAYLLHTSGELCLSPVGLSAVTRLAVPSVVGVMMGAWFLATAYSEFVAVQLAKLAAIETVDGSVADIGLAIARYNELFTSLLYIGLGVGFVLLLLSPLLRKLMHGVH